MSDVKIKEISLGVKELSRILTPEAFVLLEVLAADISYDGNDEEIFTAHFLKFKSGLKAAGVPVNVALVLMMSNTLGHIYTLLKEIDGAPEVVKKSFNINVEDVKLKASL